MMRRLGIIWLALWGIQAFGCGDGGSSSPDGNDDTAKDPDAGSDIAADTNTNTDTDTGLDVSICDPGAGPFSAEIDNPFFPLPVGSLLVLEGSEDRVVRRLERAVLEGTEVVAGIEARVLEEREYADGKIEEASRNFFVQAADGTVCCYGEDVDNYDTDGQIVAHEAAWRAGVNGALPGIQMLAAPAVGLHYNQELAFDISEDHGEITAMDEPLSVPAGDFTDTLRIVETSRLDADVSLKIYVRDIGMAVDETMELISYSL